MPLNFKGVAGGAQDFLANYDYYDISAGVGVETFYLTRDSAGAGVLTNKAFEANASGQGYIRNSTATYTFDTNEFQTQRIIKGNVILSLSRFVDIPGGFGTDYDVDVNTIKLIHVHSAGTTDLTAEVSLSTFTETETGGSSYEVTVVSLGEVSQTTIKKGDKLRLSMALVASMYGGIFINPARTPIAPIEETSFESTRSSLEIPFKINL